MTLRDVIGREGGGRGVQDEEHMYTHRPLTSSQGNTPRSLGDHKVGGKQSHEEHPHMLSPPWGALHQFSPLILTAILYCAHSTEEKN